MKKITLLTLLLPCLFLNGYSVSLDSYLSYVEQKFDKSTSTEAKRYEVIKPLNIKYLSEVSSIEDIDESQLVVEDFKTISFSNALALAIASGDVKKTKKFLKVIDDVNDGKLVSSAGREELVIGLPHIAVNPLRQLKIFDKQAKLDSDHAIKMLRIIDLLAQRGANFNMSDCAEYNGRLYLYNNTPLVHAESVSSYYSSDLKPQYELMARAILYGADPKLYDLSGYLIEYYKGGLKNLKPLILEYYAQLSINPIKSKKVKLAESVLVYQDISKIIEAIDKKQSNSSVHKTAPKAVNKVSSQSDNESTPKAVTEVSSSLCCSIL
ncbi:hypothetical protein [Francisella hispaniensis]|uniref:Uncharacterized protein n=1 Tax=Francisella hispaniensis FSC454 TaxID=1088883 RepID=A0AAC9J7A3_9GAMM|nr:hypothetical protein [Francisella hispaniensis]APD50406.1 hypothetical protein FSC454_04325 [Francisella hispaniensis FSC454]